MPNDHRLLGSQMQIQGVPTDGWTLELQAGERAFARGTRAVSAWALMLGIGPACRARIATACAEVLDNASRHAYPDAAGSISVTVSRRERELNVTIEDRGIGMETEPRLTATSPGQAPAGLARAASLCERLDLESTPFMGTAVRMTFSIYQVFFEEESRVDLSDLDYLPPATARTLLDRIQSDGAGDAFFLSPALAMTVGRLLTGPADHQSAKVRSRS